MTTRRFLHFPRMAAWLAWLLFLLLAGGEFCHLHWEGALVMFAALLLVPSGLRLLGHASPTGYWWAVAALGLAYVLWPHPAAAVLALPYALLAVATAAQAAYRQWENRDFGLAALLPSFALAYWAVGAGWAVAFLAHYGPLGFSPDITALTAAHFHVAGYALTVAVCCLWRASAGLPDRVLSAGAVLGMPAVAAGIVATQMGLPTGIEQGCGVLFGIFAAGVAARHIALCIGGGNVYPAVARWYWALGAISLCAGATLAILYAMRFSWLIDWVNIPNMKAWHGTLNTLGFAWLMLLGWEVYSSQAGRAGR